MGDIKGDGVVGSCTGVCGNCGIAVAGVAVGVPRKIGKSHK